MYGPISKKRIFSVAALLLALLLYEVLPLLAPPEEGWVEEPYQDEMSELHQVVKVVDGDTIDVDIDGTIERLRLIGVDTPETVDPRKPVQCFGREASDRTKEMLAGQEVFLEADPSQGERDKYGRLLRYVILQDGTDLNLSLIADGYAHEYTYDDPYAYQADFKAAEEEARRAERGLWSPTTCAGVTE